MNFIELQNLEKESKDFLSHIEFSDIDEDILKEEDIHGIVLPIGSHITILNTKKTIVCCNHKKHYIMVNRTFCHQYLNVDISSIIKTIVNDKVFLDYIVMGTILYSCCKIKNKFKRNIEYENRYMIVTKNIIYCYCHPSIGFMDQENIENDVSIPNIDMDKLKTGKYTVDEIKDYLRIEKKDKGFNIKISQGNKIELTQRLIKHLSDIYEL